MLSNIEVEEEENGELTVYTNFMVIELRRRQQNTWTGRMMYRLRPENGELKMALKKVMLINNDEEIPGFQFLL
jgi:3-phenylpropionate/cinnamic acid dioxygenase small subunit